MNNFKINGTDPDIIMSKGQQVDRIYSKGTLVWEKSCDLDGIIDCYVEEDPEPSFPEVTIGTQTWMAVNLDVDDGQGGIYAYDNNEANVATYGRLYTWAAAVRVAASIDGWHLPTDAEWTTLTDYLGGLSVAGGKLKETGITHWNSPNEGATNETSFTARPGGWCNRGGTFMYISDQGFWWSATESSATYAWFHFIKHNYGYVSRTYNLKKSSYSVRLIRD
jgi:uncharacterized protein (TIGR02145 family)